MFWEIKLRTAVHVGGITKQNLIDKEKINYSIKIDGCGCFGLVEIENDFSPPSSSNAIQDIVNGLNASLGTTTYSWVDPGIQFVGDDAIAVGVIYKPSKYCCGHYSSDFDDSNLAGLGLPTSVAVLMGQGQSCATSSDIQGSKKRRSLYCRSQSFKIKGSAGAAELQTMIQMTELLTLTKQDLMLLQP
jgi:hypothetical protein